MAETIFTVCFLRYSLSFLLSQKPLSLFFSVCTLTFALIHNVALYITKSWFFV